MKGIKQSYLFICVLTVAGVLFMHGCRTPMALHSSTAVTDTEVVREVLRDTAFIVGADSAMIQALIECDSLGRARIREIAALKSGLHVAPPQIAINPNNILTATAQVDSFFIYATLRDRYTEKKSIKEEVIEKIIEVNRLTWWQTLWIKIGRTLLIILAVYIVVRVAGIKFKQQLKTN